MAWTPPWMVLASIGPNVSPIDAATNSVVGYILGYGPIGIIVIALVFGWPVVPAWIYRAKAKEAGDWKALYESEREGHQHTRDAYTLQGERLQVAIESARVTEQLFREARGRVATTPQEV